MVVAMTPQLGDHFAQGADSYASPAERHLGFPYREREIEDRAQEARRGAQRIRQRAYTVERARAFRATVHP